MKWAVCRRNDKEEAVAYRSTQDDVEFRLYLYSETDQSWTWSAYGKGWAAYRSLGPRKFQTVKRDVVKFAKFIKKEKKTCKK